MDYGSYMASREWRLKRKLVLFRSDGICERCERWPADDIHHLSYEHLGDEPLEDLQALCRGCHAFVSAATEEDPQAAPIDEALIVRIARAVVDRCDRDHTSPLRLIWTALDISASGDRRYPFLAACGWGFTQMRLGTAS